MKIIDQEVIEGLLELGDKDFLVDLIDIFLAQSDELIQEIKQAAEANNPGDITKAAHKLKGSCLNLGAGELGAICQQLEVLGKKNDLSGISPVLEPLDSVYQQTCAELIKYK